MPEQTQQPKQSTYHWYRQWWGIMILIVLILIVSAILALSVAVSKSVKRYKSEQATNSSWLRQLTPVPNAKLLGKNYSLGATKPKISIVEFSDFGCIHCKNEYPTLRNLVMKNFKDYELIYRDYPVVTENSTNLSHAGRCAGEQGLFWKMHDFLFDHQGIGTDEELIAAAKNIGANTKTFTTCLQTKKYAKDISADLNIGNSFKIEGTPTIFINNYQLPPGEIPEATLEEIIQEILNNDKLSIPNVK